MSAPQMKCATCPDLALGGFCGLREERHVSHSTYVGDRDEPLADCPHVVVVSPHEAVHIAKRVEESEYVSRRELVQLAVFVRYQERE